MLTLESMRSSMPNDLYSSCTICNGRRAYRPGKLSWCTACEAPHFPKYTLEQVIDDIASAAVCYKPKLLKTTLKWQAFKHPNDKASKRWLSMNDGWKPRSLAAKVMFNARFRASS